MFGSIIYILQVFSVKTASLTSSFLIIVVIQASQDKKSANMFVSNLEPVDTKLYRFFWACCWNDLVWGFLVSSGTLLENLAAYMGATGWMQVSSRVCQQCQFRVWRLMSWDRGCRMWMRSCSLSCLVHACATLSWVNPVASESDLLHLC